MYLIFFEIKYSSVSSAPSLMWGIISCSNLEFFLILEIQIFKYGRLLKVGIIIENTWSIYPK